MENPQQPPQMPTASGLNQPMPQTQAAGQTDSTGGVIPYKNPTALTSYYLAIFSLIPVLGLLLGFIALIMGIAGFKKYLKTPVIRGQVHAWIGIILGGGIFVLHIVVIAMMFAGS